jgi:transposase-like protein
MTSIDRLQTLEQAARVLQLTPSTLRRWVRQGRIHGHTLDTDIWSVLLDFTIRPSTYFCAREVLADASRR